MKRTTKAFLGLGVLLSVTVLLLVYFIHKDYSRTPDYPENFMKLSKIMTLESFLKSNEMYDRLERALGVLQLDPRDLGRGGPWGECYVLNKYRTFRFYSPKDRYELYISPDSPSLVSRFSYLRNQERRKEGYEIRYGYDALLAKEKAIEFMDTLGPVLETTPKGVSVGPVIERQYGSAWCMQWIMYFGKAVCGGVYICVSLETGQILSYEYFVPVIPKRTTIKIGEHAAIAIADAWAKKEGLSSRILSELCVCRLEDRWSSLYASAFTDAQYYSSLQWHVYYSLQSGSDIMFATIDAETGTLTSGPGSYTYYRPRDYY